MFRLRMVFCGLGLAAVCGGAVGQTAGGGEQAVRDAVVKKRVLLRGFSADHEVHWRWDGTEVVQDPPKTHSLSVLIARSVSVTGHKVEIHGERQAILRTSATALTLSGLAEETHIVVDLSGADLNVLLPKLAAMIFYPDLKSALADLPPDYRGMLPLDASVKCCKTGPTPEAKRCDCASPSVEACGLSRPSFGMGGFKNPVYVSQSVELDFLAATRQGYNNRAIPVALILDANGNPDYVALIAAVDTEVGVNVLDTVRSYKFKPATCHDRPVAVPLFIDVTFSLSQ